MRKLFGLALLAVAASALFVVPPALAGSGPDNEYQGRAEHDTGTYFGFDVNKNAGKTKIARVGAELKYHCSNGVGNEQFGAFARGQLRVKADKSFSGKLDVPIMARGEGAVSDFSYVVKGKLAKHGKASGTIDANFHIRDTGARGTLNSHCYSGVLRWKAKRGAHVSLPAREIKGAHR